ncbi:MAG: hypothetical protein ACE5GE_07685, partial [Phycisphaerae bacterium]
MRQVPLPLLIPYAMGSLEYHGVADHLEVAGPAQVCVIGSSRAREAIVPPRMAKVCHDRLGRSVTVANYACAGARAAENESLIKYMLRQGKPEFILYGLSPRQLLERDAPRSHEESTDEGPAPG